MTTGGALLKLGRYYAIWRGKDKPKFGDKRVRDGVGGRDRGGGNRDRGENKDEL
jgi:hypothetical protein